MYKVLVLLMSCCAVAGVQAQSRVQFQFQNPVSHKAVPGVTVSENAKTVAVADSSGAASLSLQAGIHSFSFSAVGYERENC